MILVDTLHRQVVVQAVAVAVAVEKAWRPVVGNHRLVAAVVAEFV
jgi:uncharacterized protein (DUF2062 family)